MILGAIYGIVWFSLFFCLQLVLVRSVSPQRLIAWNKRSLLISLVAVSATIGTIQALNASPALTWGGWQLGALWGTLTFLCLYVLYMPFYFVVMTSLSVDTIVMLLKQPSRRLPLAALRERFTSEQFVTDRFEIMGRNGLLRKTPQSYCITGKGRRAIRPFMLVKALWRLGAGG